VALSLTDFLAKRQHLAYLLFPLLPKGSRLIIGAPPKHFKSFLTLNLAYALAEGGEFLKWKAERPQRVLYIEQEIGWWGMNNRLATLHAAKGGSIAGDNLFIEAKGKVRYSLDEGSPGFERLKQLVAKVDPDVLILDPLRKFTRADEDSSTEMVKVFQALDELQAREDEDGTKRAPLTVVLVHHAGKRSEFRDGTTPESLRGSSEIFADGDSYIILEQPVKGKPEVLRMHFTFRHAANIEPLRVTFEKESGVFTYG